MANIDKKYKQVNKKNYKEPAIPAGGAKYIYDSWNSGVGGKSKKRKPSGAGQKKTKWGGK